MCHPSNILTSWRSFQQLLLACLQTLNTQRETLQSQFFNVLFKSCWSITQLVNPAGIDGWTTPAEVRLCELLCNIFVLVGNSVDELHSVWYSISLPLVLIHAKVKDILIEALTLLNHEALLLALGHLQKDVKVHFVLKTEDSKNYFPVFKRHLTRTAVITRAKRLAQYGASCGKPSYIVYFQAQKRKFNDFLGMGPTPQL